jgi:excisionase family DNA binding protein
MAMKYLSPTEVAKIIGFNPATVYRAVERGHLRATKPPGTNRIRIAEDDLEEWLAAGRVKTASQLPMPITRPRRSVPQRGRFMPLADIETGPGA